MKRFMIFSLILAMAFLLIAANSPAEDLPEVPAVVANIINLLVGFVGVPLITWVKERINAEDRKALFLTLGISFVLGTAALYLTGFLIPAEFTASAIISVISQVLAAAMFSYRLLAKPAN